MAKQPSDLVLRILREIQATQAKHGRAMVEHSRMFEQVKRRLDDIHEGMITSLGLASHTHVRHDTIQKEIDNLKKRVKRLEEKV
ncbi:MAG TPA: hypothetical protein VH684_14335 [Xanthobacteraceae bacterium]|jgi:uncharacterized coiled-coil DUF342 family protein